MNSKYVKTAVASAIAAFSSITLAATFGEVTIDENVVGKDQIINALKNAENKTVNINGQNSAISTNSEDLTVLGKELHFEGKASDAISIANAGNIKIGSSDTENIVIQSNAGNGYAAVFIRNGDVKEKPEAPSIEITGKNVSFIVNDGVGIWAQNNTETNPSPTEASKVTVNAENTTIKAKTGIIAFSNSRVSISGNLTIDSSTAIDTRGHSTVDINGDGKGIVKITGDITFETPQGNSGKYINSTVNLNLVGTDSSWTGSVSKLYPSAWSSNDPATQVTGLSLKLS